MGNSLEVQASDLSDAALAKLATYFRSQGMSSYHPTMQAIWSEQNLRRIRQAVAALRSDGAIR